MAESRRMTLGELFKEKEAEAKANYARLLAYEATDEGKAEVARRSAEFKRRQEADEKFARENPPDHYQHGKDAALGGDPREAPEDLSDEEEAKWLEGWDSEGPDEELR